MSNELRVNWSSNMYVVTINSQNRVTIPKEIREEFDLKPGDRVTFVQEGGMLSLVKVRGIEHAQEIISSLRDMNFHPEEENKER